MSGKFLIIGAVGLWILSRLRTPTQAGGTQFIGGNPNAPNSLFTDLRDAFNTDFRGLATTQDSGGLVGSPSQIAAATQEGGILTPFTFTYDAKNAPPGTPPGTTITISGGGSSALPGTTYKQNFGAN
jgi:hypothetical protein